jgi:hypothetical protein
MPEPNLLFSAICQQDKVKFEAFGQSAMVAKNDFGFIVIVTDFFVIIIYLYFVKYLSGVQIQYHEMFEDEVIMMNDFTVRFKNLPKGVDFDGNELILKA